MPNGYLYNFEPKKGERGNELGLKYEQYTSQYMEGCITKINAMLILIYCTVLNFYTYVPI